MTYQKIFTQFKTNITMINMLYDVVEKVENAKTREELQKRDKNCKRESSENIIN